MTGFAVLSADSACAEALEGLIQKKLALCCAEAELCVYSAAETLLADAGSHDFRMYFLDADCEGIPAAKKLRETDKTSGIVIFSASGRRALESYSVHPVAFLVKPLREEPVFDAMDWCASLWRDALRCLSVVSKRVTVRIALRDIAYIEVAGRTCLLRWQTGSVAVNRSLSSIEQELGGEPFFRCHKSFIVNRLHISKVLPDSFIMDGGEKIPVTAETAIS